MVSDMSPSRLEILVEPFRESDPGPHVTAVLDVLTQRGFVVDMGPFSSSVEGELIDLVGALEELCTAGFNAGATNIQTRITRQ